jgi:hypothetical protein
MSSQLTSTLTSSTSFTMEDSSLLMPKSKDNLYLFCICLRILFGYFLLYNGDKLMTDTDKYKLKKIKLWCLGIMILIFTIIYFKKPLNWKCYPRNILSNMIVFSLIVMNKNDLATGLFFVDILNGIQSKHTKILIEEIINPLQKPYKL